MPKTPRIALLTTPPAGDSLHGMKTCYIVAAAIALSLAAPAGARIKLVALPDRGPTTIRLDNPHATLIEEERVLTLQKGVNQVDFSWNGVFLDEDSIRLAVLSPTGKVTLLNVSYPPGEQALVWELAAEDACEVTTRISYLLLGVDRLVTYTAAADKPETRVNLKSHIVLRNFSGEDFERAQVVMDGGVTVAESTAHEETKQLLFFNIPNVPVRKVWTFDAAILPWDPEQLNTNVGIPVRYEIENAEKAGLGRNVLWSGKVRVFQDDGRGGTILLGEDRVDLIPVGEKMKLYIGDSRDIVVTQRKMREQSFNHRRNNAGRVVLYDMDEVISVKMENFKDSPAVLTLIQHIPGQWEMKECNLPYRREEAGRIEFDVELPARGMRELTMHYQRRNVR